MTGYILPSSLAPFADESLAGLIMRNAEPYRFRNPLRLFRRLHLHRQRLSSLCQADPEGDLGRSMGHLLGLTPSSLKRISPWSPEEGGTQVLGHCVWNELVLSDRRAVCPECLRVSPHHRAVWQVAALPVCDVHSVRLVEKCPNPRCGKPLRWNGRALCECEWSACRVDLRTAIADPVDLNRFQGVTRLIELMTGKAGTTPLGAPVGRIVTLAFLLGRVATGLERTLRPLELIEREGARLPELMDAGWRALDDWPVGFHALLGARKAKGGNARGVKQAFGRLSLQVHQWAREPWGVPIGKAFAEYATSQPDLPLSVRRLAQYAPGVRIRNTHMSVLQAAEQLGMAPSQTMELMKRLGLIVLASDGGGVPSLVRTSDVRLLKKAAKDCVDLEAVKRLLGTEYSKTVALERAGLIRRVPMRDRLLVSKPFLASQVAEFLESCLTGAPRMSAVQADGLGLKRLTRCSSAGYGLPDVCRAIIEGRLRVRAEIDGARGLHRIRIDYDEMRTSVEGGRTTLSLVEAAKTIRARHTDLAVWVRRGLLVATESTSIAEKGLRIRREDWAGFRATYLAGTDFLDFFGSRDDHSTSRHLLPLGVRPVSGPKVDGSTACIYRRSECSTEILEGIIRLRAGPDRGHGESFRLSFDKVLAVARLIEREWAADFKRTNNFFEDRRTGRALHVIVGRRRSIHGAVWFNLHPSSMARLHRTPDVSVALVPSEGQSFLLVLPDALDWKGREGRDRYVAVAFDMHGAPIEHSANARTLSVGVHTPKHKASA